ncbi:MAG: porin [Rhodoferax sp.]|nr:porin [Rhodoferax sp.]
MKKSLVALAVLAASGAVMAQSSVTIGGKVFVGLVKMSDSSTKVYDPGNTAGSRVFFRGTEDLGGGLKANFALEERFNSDNGTTGSTVRRFHAYSTVGLAGGFGAVNFGRQYTAGFTAVNNAVDPFGGDTVAALRNIGMTTKNVRVDNSIRYDGAFGGVKLAASWATDEGEPIVAGGADVPFVTNPVSLALTYAGGPVAAGITYEKGGNDSKETQLFGSYDFGVAKASLGFATYDTVANVNTKSWLLAATAPVGSGLLKAGYARSETAGLLTNAKFGLGYQYNLSKRTWVGVNYGKDSEVAVNGSGIDFVLSHSF